MGKYEPLASFLKAQDRDSVTVTFTQIEAALGFELPRSAREYRAWWSNQRGPGHSQKEGWQSAGWATKEVDLARGIVRFEKLSKRIPGPSSEAPPSASEELWQRAFQVTNISSKGELIEEALKALLAREAATNLLARCGAMPDFEPAPRQHRG